MSSVPITRSAARSIGASIRRHANARVSGSFSVSADDYKLSGTCCISSSSNARSISNACHRRRRRLPVRPPTFDYTQQHRTNRNTRLFSTAADDDETINNTGDDGLECLPELSPPMRSRIRTMKSRHDEVLSQLQGGGDQIALGKELSTLTGISNLCDKVSEIHAERESLLELRNESEEDEELMEEIRDELDQLELQLPPLSQKMMKQLVPLLNPDDIDDLTGADAVIDIRAGTGGDEACLFAGDIMAGYEQIAKRGGGDESGNGGKAWDIEILSIGRTDLGGVKEASLSITSRSGGGGGGGYSSFESDDNDADQDTAQKLLQQLGPYGFFQYESGVHRVQRVPVNDVRMQTSAVSVAVLPSLADNQISSALPSDELKIDVMRASGAGGQHVNTTESAVRITHIPTGIMAYMQEERSQHKNKSKGLKLVAARVHALRKEQSLKDRSAARGALMGGGDRSERIRTYNFPQDRITDHRCKVSVSGVQSWLGGGGMVRKFGPELYVMEREERVKTMEEEDEEMRRRKNEAAKGGKKGKGKGGKKR